MSEIGSLIKIYPEIEFNAKCPKDGADLDNTGVVITGMRCLADTICSACSSRYYVDLPVGQALWSPVILNQTTAEIYDWFEYTWFSNLLKEGFLNQVTAEITPIVHKFFDADRIVIVNCLDFLYGHSLLKLLNVQRYLGCSPELGCCVLVPSQLVHLVPEGVAEIWEFPVSIKEGWKWYNYLAQWMSEQITKRKECFLSPAYSHPSNRDYNLGCFVRNLPDISEEISQHQPIILFSYREDRLWGRSLRHQQRNLQKLYDKLSAIFPDMAFVMVGFGQQNQIRHTGAKLIDLRENKFDVERDRLWMAYMSAADCAIGVHGSNMLLPSGLAKSTVELVPCDRLGNSVQSFLFASDMQDIRDALLFYRILYGNETLSNIEPSDVTDMIANLFSHTQENYYWFKSDENKAISKTMELFRERNIFNQSVSHLQFKIQQPWIIRKFNRVVYIILTVVRSPISVPSKFVHKYMKQQK